MNEQPQTSPIIVTYSLGLALASLILIFMGGLVTSTGSGLSVPDWPLSFGRVFPPMKGGVIFEHSHRLVAAFIGILTIGLVILTMVKQSSPLLKKLAWVALGIVILQGVLGGVTVLLGLSVLVSVAHACLGQLFFSLIVGIMVMATQGWQAVPHPRQGTPTGFQLHHFAFLTWGLIFLQLVFGAVLRHSGRLLHWHITGAVLIVILATIIRKKIVRGRKEDPEGTSWGAVSLSLMFLAGVHFQILLGLITYVLVYTKYKYDLPSLVSVPIVTLHVMTGALLMALAVLLSLWSYRTRSQ